MTVSKIPIVVFEHAYIQAAEDILYEIYSDSIRGIRSEITN